MNGKKKNNINYTATDIQKYLEGKLSASEMHAIEKAALNDEFLADAIEGIEVYKTNNTGDFNIDVEKLRALIESRKKDKYAPVLWKAAAVIAIVATVIALTFNQYKSEKKSEVLATKNIGPKEEEPQKEVEQKTAIPSATLADTIKENNTPETTVIKKSSSRQTRETPSLASVYLKKEEIETDSFSPVTLADQSKSSPSPVKALEGKAAGIAINNKRNKALKTFTGFVKDEKGNPVVGASVLIKGSKVGTLTDEEGSFKINDDNKDSTLNVIVNSIGFNDAEKKIFLNKPSGNNIILYNSYAAGLDEVVVSGYSGSEERLSESRTDDNIVLKNPDKAKPVTGWKEFKKYLRENKRTDSLWKGDEGNVIISFQIDEKGIPYDFTIEKSLTPFYDQEAIRLVKEGPRWKLRKFKTAKLSVNIDF